MEQSNKDTQNAWVLSKLESGSVLSSLDSVLNYGIQDLPKRISELRAMGHQIESERVNGINRHGRSTHWNLYWIEQS